VSRKASIDKPDKTMVNNCQSFDPCFHFSRNVLAISCPSDGRMNSVSARSNINIAGSDQAKLLPKTHDQCCSLKNVANKQKWILMDFGSTVIRF